MPLPTFANGITKTMLHQEWAMTIEQAIEAEAHARSQVEQAGQQPRIDRPGQQLGRGGAETEQGRGAQRESRSGPPRIHAAYLGGQMNPAPLGFGKHPTDWGMTSRGSQSTTSGNRMIRVMTRKKIP